MKKGITSLLLTLTLLFNFTGVVQAAEIPKVETPDYKVAFYAFDCYHMEDENGKRYGYGYEMMQNISKYMQCTFSYVGYDKSASECVEMLRNGELDIYTAAKLTPERQEEFAISTHPAITATTCMNVKVGNTKVVAGDYSTYDGLRIGLLQRHTYNDKFLAWAEEKGFSYETFFYETPTELTQALINDEVDALVNSYIRIPEDEQQIENFGQTPYYIMARKEDQALIDEIDAAMDRMNTETPNWRVELYNKYYGEQSLNTAFTEEEERLLQQLKDQQTVIRGVMNPDGSPYSWYEDGEAKGIAPELFKATARRLGLDYEIIPVADREEYLQVLASGEADIWMDCYDADGTDFRYKTTEPYLTSTVSILRNRGASGKVERLAVIDNNTAEREILEDNWEDAEVITLESTQECVQQLLSGNVDGALLMTYTAQKLARDDVQNRLRADIVPGAAVSLCMGINADDTYDFYGIWEKTLTIVADQLGAEVVQSYVDTYEVPSTVAYIYDHPTTLIIMITGGFLIVFLLLFSIQSGRSRRRQQQISDQLATALKDAQKANEAKQNFFSKMSHDIRTPLNVVLGMTQIAQKNKQNPEKVENALDNIASEGQYLLVLINSILDVNQLEHGHIELNKEPFNPVECVRNSVEILKPLAEKKQQQMQVECNREDMVIIGDPNRFSQIVINIISNAIKYTDNGGTIQVKLECLPDNRLQFSCKDNGIGMSEEFIEHITEDYVRAEDSRVSKVQGTGLGMSVVKGFTDLMKGTLTVKSQLGVGSVFIVEIPVEEAEEEQRRRVMAPVEDKDVTAEKIAGKKVLLAEDNDLNAEIAMELLKSLGLEIDWAENGALAVEKFYLSAPGEYAAIFMDMQMPVMDGVEATKEIRASDRPDNDILIFAMTANTFASDRKLCKDAGMNGYIPKPINIAEIARTLKENIA